MRKKAYLFMPVVLVFFVISIILCVMLFLADRSVFLFSVSLLLLGIAFALIWLKIAEKDINRFLNETGKALAQAQKESLVSFPMPVVIVSDDDEIIWYNELCKRVVFQNKDHYATKISEIAPDFNYKQDCPAEGFNININNRLYSVFVIKNQKDGKQMYVMFFIDDNDLKKYSKEFFETRPSVLIITIDNYEELSKYAKENERTQILSEVEQLIEEFVEATNGLIRRIERDKFVAVIEERYMREIIESRFNILDKVRKIEAADRMPATLSIGVGRGAATLQECETMARQALDMSLGRGGDQAAVKTAGGFEFYGGISKGVEKRTKVKTRIVATALSEIIETSDNVVIMGHKFADLDCFGAAVGLQKSISQKGKSCIIAIDKQRNLVGQLYSKLAAEGYEASFMNPAEVLPLINKKTLLIIVDTHVKQFLESIEIYEQCKHVVVIDHHRKMVNHIDNAVIFYHEPFASSASEMVTELIQYLGENQKLSRTEAEALLAGIMLDTKNFVLRTGVRTFEAAAYLKKLGADTVEVKKLFALSMESYKKRTMLVSNAEIYRNCAIAVADSSIENLKIVAPQTADELLNITNVNASFVMYEYEDGFSFSARSMGAMNVQVVMEKLGGGGHHTMAGAVIKGVSAEAARHMLLQAIDDYYDEKPSN
ncbi:MAG TPA: hypothetical protein DCP97_01435 [Ruminococcaceae bacterium]|nr:hypothetical protein [Oscillospiraceae bacterium]